MSEEQNGSVKPAAFAESLPVVRADTPASQMAEDDIPVEVALEPTVKIVTAQNAREEEAQRRAEIVLAELLAEGSDAELALLREELALENEPAARALLEYEIGRLLEQRGGEEALQSYRRAWLADPLLTPAYWALHRLLTSARDWRALLNLVDEQSQRTQDDKQRAALFYERGCLLEDRFGDTAGARKAFDEAAKLDTASLPVLFALEKIVAREGDKHRLAEIYQQLAEAVKNPEQRALFLIDRARLCDNSAEGVFLALNALQKAWETGSEQVNVLDEQERIAQAAGREDIILETIERRLELLTKEAASDTRTRQTAALLRKQAAILRQKEPLRAWDCTKLALQVMPEEPLLLLDAWELALVLDKKAELTQTLERLTQLAHAPDRASWETPARTSLLLLWLQALKRSEHPDALLIEKELIGETAGVWLALRERQVEALARGDLAVLAQLCEEEGNLALAATPADSEWAASAWQMAGILHERQDRREAARGAYQRALAIIPGYEAAFAALDANYARAAMHQERAALLDNELERDGTTRRRYLLEELYALRHGPLNDIAGATAAAQALVDLDPGELRALKRLKQLLIEAGRDDQMLRVIEQELTVTKDPADAARLLVEVGEFCEHRLGHSEDAERIYRELLDRFPGNLTALRALDRLAQRGGIPEERARTLEASAATLESADAKSLRYWELGEIYEDLLNDPGRAAKAYTRSVEEQATAHALLGQIRVWVRQRRMAQLDSAMASLEKSATPEEKPAWAEERAWLAAAVQTDEGFINASAHMERIALGAGPLLADLTRIRLAAGRRDFTALAQAMAALAMRTSDVALAATLRLRAAVLYAAMGNENACRELLINNGANPLAVWLARELFGVVPKSMAATPSEEKSAIAERLGEIEALEREGRWEEAAAMVRGALIEAPEKIEVLLAARRIARVIGDRLGYVRLTAKLGSSLRDEARGERLLREAARGFEELAARAEAILAWRRVLARQPMDKEAYDHAHALLLSADDPATLESLLSERLRFAAEKDELLFERAKLMLETGRPSRAMADFAQVFELSPSHHVALEELAKLEEEDGQLTLAIEHNQRLLANLGNSDQAYRASLRLAELQRQMGNWPDATRAVQRALQIKPDDPAAIEQLAALDLGQGNASGALAQLRALAHSLPSQRERIRIELEIARISNDVMHDPRAACEALSQALGDDPLDLEVLARLVTLSDSCGELKLKAAMLKQALEVARASLGEAASRHPWEALERIFFWQGDEDARALALQARALIDGVSPAAARMVEPKQPLSAATWERGFPLRGRGIALDLWRLTRNAVAQLYAPEMSSLGVGRNDRLSTNDIAQKFVTINKIANSLGLGELEIYLSRNRPELCLTSGRALVVGSSCGEPLAPAVRFRIAHQLVLCRDGLAPLLSIDDGELELYFAACGRVAGTTVASISGLADARVEQRAKQITSALDRRSRKALQTMAPSLGNLEDLTCWRKSVVQGAVQLALALSGDLSACVSELKIDLASETGRQLLEFLASDDIAALRRELGLRG